MRGQNALHHWREPAEIVRDARQFDYERCRTGDIETAGTFDPLTVIKALEGAQVRRLKASDWRKRMSTSVALP
jgi:hypothetical protein